MTEQLQQEWRTNRLGLAAYAKAHGAQLQKVDGYYFVMVSASSKSEWEVKFGNSDESRFNNELIGLNQLRKGQ